LPIHHLSRAVIAVVPTVLPSLMGITLYRLDDNIHSSLVLGFVRAGGLASSCSRR